MNGCLALNKGGIHKTNNKIRVKSEGRWAVEERFNRTRWGRLKLPLNVRAGKKLGIRTHKRHHEARRTPWTKPSFSSPTQRMNGGEMTWYDETWLIYTINNLCPDKGGYLDIGKKDRFVFRSMWNIGNKTVSFHCHDSHFSYILSPI